MTANRQSQAPTTRVPETPATHHAKAPKGQLPVAQLRAKTPAPTGLEHRNASSPEGAKESENKPRGFAKTMLFREVVEFNPRFGKGELADDSLASFIPMRCVEEESGRFVPLGDRKVAEVRKGYTPFRDGHVIFAKVTPCMENGKAAVLKGLTNGVGFGSTEYWQSHWHSTFNSSQPAENAPLISGASGRD